MPSYRTSSLFHYTKTVGNLFNILKSGMLIPNYCKEDLSSVDNPSFIWGIPMVSFCDIPISLADNFLKNYGHYAIGFKKKWGRQNGCSPIQYVSNENIIFSLHHTIDRINTLQEMELLELKNISNLLADRDIPVREAINQINEYKYELAKRVDLINQSLNSNDEQEKRKAVEDWESLEEDFKKLHILETERNNLRKALEPIVNKYIIAMSSIPKDNKSNLYHLGFLKKYDAVYKGKPYINYEENEWRYIVEETNSIEWLDFDKYKEWRGNSKVKPKPTPALVDKSLCFSTNEINHILLYKESQIPAFIDKIMRLKKIGTQDLTDADKRILISKISSFERMKDY